MVRLAPLQRTACAAVALAGLACLGSPAMAQPKSTAHVAPALKALVPPKDSHAVCFARRYEPSHLAAHPQQRVAGMAFGVEVEHIAEDDKYRYNFSMRVNQRKGGRALTTEGECGWAYETAPPPDGPFIRCSVECDGGGVTIVRDEKTGDLLLHLATRAEEVGLYGTGRLRFSNGCGEEKSVELEPGRDDRVFRLARAPLQQCWPGRKGLRDAKP